MKPKMRSRRYGDTRIRIAKAASRTTISTANSRARMPPRKRMPMAMAMMTTKAPKSGSFSNRMPTKTIAAAIGRKAFFRSCMTAILRTVVGGVERGKQLHQFGRLQVGDAQR